MSLDDDDSPDALPLDTSGGARSAPSWLKSIGRGAFKATGLYAAWSLLTQGPLKSDGWLRSFRDGRSVDAAGNPLPWLTYPAIELLARAARPDWQVFEYGCGESTLWWAARVAKVVSCEHDADWAAKIRARAPAHVELLHVPLDGSDAYAGTAARWPGRFDVVVIDGRRRVRCAEAALVALHPRGVIVWDNSEREEYREGYARLAAVGFRKVPFIGMIPIFNQKSETGIFYRNGNVLGL